MLRTTHSGLRTTHTGPYLDKRLTKSFLVTGLVVLLVAPMAWLAPSTFASREGATSNSIDEREWTDASGKLVIAGELMAFNDTEVVIETKKKELLSLPIEQLSEADQEYLKSKEARASVSQGDESSQIWTLKSGMKVIGHVVEYGRRDVVLKRRRGKVYVNDKHFENLPEVYQRMVPQIVNHFEGTNLKDVNELEEWLIKAKGEPVSFTCEGVWLELDNGDLYGVPFFFFSDADQRVLKQGWDRWAQADADEQERLREATYLEATARAYQQQQAQEAQQREYERQVTQMQMQLLAVAATVTDMWEVQMVPRANVYAPYTSVIVTAANSEQASVIAQTNYPGFTIAGVRKLNRNGNRFFWR